MSDEPSITKIDSTKPHEEGFVMLPYNKEQFREFITSLLGSPQTIGKVIRGEFEIGLDDLRNVHQLIMQRVSQQNDGVLIQFKAKIFYSDESSIELASADELLTYNEIRPVVSESVHLDWTFVVKFQDKEKPEKQRIQLSIISSGSGLPDFDFDRMIGPRIVVHGRGSGFFNFRIEHTARTWGADIEAMLSNHIQCLCKKGNPVREFISKHSGKISFTTVVLLFLSVCIGLYLSIARSAASRLAELKAATQAVDVPKQVNATMDYIAQFIVTGAWNRRMVAQLIAIVIGLVVSIVIGIWVEDAASTTPESFILLTKESVKHRDAALCKRQRKWLSFLLSIVTAIVTGIVSNILFVKMFN